MDIPESRSGLRTALFDGLISFSNKMSLIISRIFLVFMGLQVIGRIAAQGETSPGGAPGAGAGSGAAGAAGAPVPADLARQTLPEYVVSECYGGIFSFDCGEGNKMRINRDFFGFNPAGRSCSYTHDDCTVSNPKSNSLIHRYCTGRRGCTYYQVERRACNGFYSNYQQVEYQCVPDASVLDVCQPTRYEAETTYIASPKFPGNYPPHLSCACVVKSLTPQARVRLEVVYMAIKFNSPCRDWLQIGKKRICGTTMDLFAGQTIPIEFQTNGEESHSGFWLHFQSSVEGGRFQVECGNTSVLATAQQRPATRESQVMPTRSRATPRRSQATPTRSQATPSRAQAPAAREVPTSRQSEATPTGSEATPSRSQTAAAREPAPSDVQATPMRPPVPPNDYQTPPRSQVPLSSLETPFRPPVPPSAPATPRARAATLGQPATPTPSIAAPPRPPSNPSASRWPTHTTAVYYPRLPSSRDSSGNRDADMGTEVGPERTAMHPDGSHGTEEVRADIAEEIARFSAEVFGDDARPFSSPSDQPLDNRNAADISGANNQYFDDSGSPRRQDRLGSYPRVGPELWSRSPESPSPMWNPEELDGPFHSAASFGGTANDPYGGVDSRGVRIDGVSGIARQSDLQRNPYSSGYNTEVGMHGAELVQGAPGRGQPREAPGDHTAPWEGSVPNPHWRAGIQAGDPDTAAPPGSQTGFAPDWRSSGTDPYARSIGNYGYMPTESRSREPGQIPGGEATRPSGSQDDLAGQSYRARGQSQRPAIHSVARESGSEAQGGSIASPWYTSIFQRPHYASGGVAGGLSSFTTVPTNWKQDVGHNGRSDVSGEAGSNVLTGRDGLGDVGGDARGTAGSDVSNDVRSHAGNGVAGDYGRPAERGANRSDVAGVRPSLSNPIQFDESTNEQVAQLYHPSQESDSYPRHDVPDAQSLPGPLEQETEIPIRESPPMVVSESGHYDTRYRDSSSDNGNDLEEGHVTDGEDGEDFYYYYNGNFYGRSQTSAGNTGTHFGSEDASLHDIHNEMPPNEGQGDNYQGREMAEDGHHGDQDKSESTSQTGTVTDGRHGDSPDEFNGPIEHNGERNAQGMIRHNDRHGDDVGFIDNSASAASGRSVYDDVASGYDLTGNAHRNHKSHPDTTMPASNLTGSEHPHHNPHSEGDSDPRTHSDSSDGLSELLRDSAAPINDSATSKFDHDVAPSGVLGSNFNYRANNSEILYRPVVGAEEDEIRSDSVRTTSRQGEPNNTLTTTVQHSIALDEEPVGPEPPGVFNRSGFAGSRDTFTSLISITASNRTVTTPTTVVEELGDGSLLTLGIIILCVCVGLGVIFLLMACVAVFFRRRHHHATRNEETQTPTCARSNTTSTTGGSNDQDTDSGQELLRAVASGEALGGYRRGTGHQTQINGAGSCRRPPGIDRCLQVDLGYVHYDEGPGSRRASSVLSDSDNSSLYVTPPPPPPPPVAPYGLATVAASGLHKSVQVGYKYARDRYVNDPEHAIRSKLRRKKPFRYTFKDAPVDPGPDRAGSPSSPSALSPTIEFSDESTVTPPSGSGDIPIDCARTAGGACARQYQPHSDSWPDARVHSNPSLNLERGSPRYPGDRDDVSCSDQEGDALKRRSLASMSGLAEMTLEPESAAVHGRLSDESDWETRSAISL